MTMFEVPAAAVLPAVRVNTLDPVVGFVPNTAATPVGSPDAVSVTLPVNPPASTTVIVSVAADPSVTDRVGADVVSVKLGVCVAFMVSETFALAVREPEVPVIVRLEVPAAAALLAVRVSTLEAVAGLVPNDAVT